MGLRTASVRHPHVVDMAPALTETVQTQNFDLPPKSCLEPAYPIKSLTKNKYELKTQLYSKERGEDVQQYPLNSSEITNTATILKEKILEKYWDNIVTASDIDNLPNLNSNMNESPSSMGDQGNNKMGLQNTDLNVSSLSREKSSNDMEQLLQNLHSVLPDAVEGVTTGDVEDIMQVIKSFEGTERLNNSANDLNSEGEEIFHIGGTDLTNNFSSLAKEFLEHVDVMNMSIEDQQDELDSEVVQKESQADEVLEVIKKKHLKIERRLDFLKRRVYKLETRFTGQHISNEIAGVFENVSRNMKKSKDDESSFAGSLLPNRDMMPMKPMSYSSTKTIVKKLEMSKILQANNSARQKGAPKYFGSGSIEVPPPRGANSAAVHLAPWPMDTKSELQKVVGQLKTQTSLTQRDVDSEATESSSGGESCDEMISYNNPHQQYLSIQKRALWKYSSDRAAIGARWTWLQAQIADLEYRIRQHSDLAKQIRAGKVAVQLGGLGPEQSVQATLNGYRGQLPGSSPAAAKTAAEGAAAESDIQCARTRPLTAFKKRKLLQIAGLHAVSRKAARPSGVRCGCVPLALPPCAVCTGRTDPTLPRDPIDAMGGAEKVAMLDGGYHPVFSLPEDTSENIHLEALMKTQDWQLRSNRMKTYKVLKPDRLEPKSVDHRTRKLEHRKKYGRLLKPTTMSALTAKIRNKIRGRKPGGRHALDRVHRQRRANAGASPAGPDRAADDEVAALGGAPPPGYCLRSTDSPSASPLLHAHAVASGHKRNKFDAYDIDNIVIPYSVAAATRVEKLQYKEILTPKWRIAEMDCSLGGYDAVNNGAVKEFDQDSDTEDVTEEAVHARHDRAERDEKQRFLGYLKLPTGRGGAGSGRAPRRADSRADESSEAATPPDAMSPPPTPAVVEQEAGREESRGASPADLLVEVAPYESRTFPIDDPTYAQMLDHMPENHRQFRTNARSQDALLRFPPDNDDPPSAPYEGRAGSPADSESTESAVGEDAEEEDPNDPEWVDVERGVAKERYRR